VNGKYSAKLACEGLFMESVKNQLQIDYISEQWITQSLWWPIEVQTNSFFTVKDQRHSDTTVRMVTGGERPCLFIATSVSSMYIYKRIHIDKEEHGFIYLNTFILLLL
jgi:hypothetical protein